jgi:hypothetical protein
MPRRGRIFAAWAWDVAKPAQIDADLHQRGEGPARLPISSGP